MKAEPAKAEEGMEEGKEGGRGGEQQSKAVGTQTERKKTDFLSTSSLERTLKERTPMFIYNEENSLSKSRDRKNTSLRV